MKVRLLLVVVFVALSLPCIEVPEFAAMQDDVSNDFIVAQPRVVPPVCETGRTPDFAAAHLQKSSVLAAFSPLLSSASIPGKARLVLSATSVQRK